MSSKKIASATIGPMPEGLLDDMAKVTVTLEDGSTKDLFEFYPNEISFRPEEFVGLTEEGARKLRHAKDVAYLKS
ncbi:hypothetical protein N9L66_00595 [Porticoccaceae bacterium]|nr:hypothetical protein [Porticoccaceae bacterium]